MAFISNNVEDYIKVFKNPELGIKMILKQKLQQQYEQRKKQKKENNDLLSDDSEEGYASDASENKYINLEDGGIDSDIISSESEKEEIELPEDVEFQIFDIDHYHVEDEDEKKKFNIMLFGKTKQDKSVYVNVEGFKPYFYVEIDSSWRMPVIQKIIEDIKKQVKQDLVDGLVSYKIIKGHKFHGFTNDENFNFLHLVFDNYLSLKAYTRVFEKKHTMPYISRHIKVTFKLYESNLTPILRFLHIQNIDPIGWCKITKDKFKSFKYNHRKGTTNININCNWQDVQRLECSEIHKISILSFDIECLSEDGKFPHNRDGDKVIQIGMTYSYLGEPDCYKKVVLCLKKTDPIPGIEVKVYNTEEKLLLAFTDEIRIQDPDIITGYNIFGFDFPYLKERAQKFHIYNQFRKLSRIKGYMCEYMEQKLESSAMGRNNLRYFQTPGRVCIDLMKYIQREYKLTGYKLDNVASNFIRDKITAFEYIREDYPDIDKIESNNETDIIKIEDAENDENAETKNDDPDAEYSTDEDTSKIDLDDDVHIKKRNKDNSKKKKVIYTKLKVKSTQGIQQNDYIALFYNDGPTDNRIGYKFKVLQMDDKSITVKGKISIKRYLNRKWDVFWCQAKDDVGPTDIFRLYRSDSKDKSIVAKYCIKDCTLCNRLMAKLQVLPNSIGMGNVCCVPLSYLFLRGQSIKIFSLVAKQCREENYIIPTTKKKYTKPVIKDANGNIIETAEQKEESKFKKFIQGLLNDDDADSDDSDDEKYEGATVFDPVKGVHYEPIIVGDFSSLYPSSMIEQNFSHESIVLDPQYDNLPGYKYRDQTYNKSDGTTKTCRYAEKIGSEPAKTKAIIPRILMKLLATRKKYKNMTDKETDSFKKAIWDGLQLAYKITANSLYGQTGSPVSPISMKDIAACTTSRGRDMLESARNYAEKIMPPIINLIKDAVENSDDTKFIQYMDNYYINVPDSKVELIDDDTKQYIYKGKSEYYQWLKKQVYELIKPYNINPQCIYGDTDSVFFKLHLTDRKTNMPFTEHGALSISIKIGIILIATLNHTFDYPQKLAYEKVYWPFIIISKKRYVGNLYETDPNKFKQKSMGLVTKRRDNADIVKVVVGGIIDWILNKRSSEGAVKFTLATLKKIITGKYNIDKFILSKTLKDKDAYANWQSMVHVVLADRMAQRDPGNKPQSNDRIPFVYVEVDKKVKLQGERVEHPDFIKENKLKIDFLFYITNQIMKPATQFLELIAQKPELIFNKYIIREQNTKSGIAPIMKYFKDCVHDQGNEISINLSDDLFGEKAKTPKNLNKKRVTKRIKNTKKIIKLV
jgi:DNA polymerase elongation subunit (family B)